AHAVEHLLGEADVAGLRALDQPAEAVALRQALARRWGEAAPSAATVAAELARHLGDDRLTVRLPPPADSPHVGWRDFVGDGRPTGRPVPSSPAGPALTAPQRAVQAPTLKRVEAVLGKVAHAPQSLRGLDELRQKIQAQFPGAGWLFRDRLVGELAELKLVKLFGFTQGGGLPSPWMHLGGDYDTERAGYLLTARLRSAERVLDPEAVPLRREGRAAAGQGQELDTARQD